MELLHIVFIVTLFNRHYARRKMEVSAGRYSVGCGNSSVNGFVRGSVITVDGRTCWATTFQKPSWSPPEWRSLQESSSTSGRTGTNTATTLTDYLIYINFQLLVYCINGSSPFEKDSALFAVNAATNFVLICIYTMRIYY